MTAEIEPSPKTAPSAADTTAYPTPSSLRRVQPWQRRVVHQDTRRQAAVHEAGHVVLMRWVGLPSPGAAITASAAGTSGEAQWPARELFASLDEPHPDESGILAATAASVFHAGVMAEMIDAKAPWQGPIRYPHATDYQQADEMLRPSFGRHASGAHAYAQRVALCVLAARWGAVEAIAGELMRAGEWKA